MHIDHKTVAPIADLLDTIITDPKARDLAKIALLRQENGRDLELACSRMAASAEQQSTDPWTRRARPSFLYVMYALLLWALPMGLIAAVRPDMARNMTVGMNAYLSGIPEPLYALFATGYLGYTVAREWGKARIG